MKTDRELLEATARLVGLWPASGSFERILARWNPLVDDMDACQLITAVPLSLRFDEDEHTIRVVHNGRLLWEAVYATSADRPAITRRAVVLAAAAMADNPRSVD